MRRKPRGQCLIDPKTGQPSKDDKKPEYVTKADLDKLSHRQKYAYLQDDEYDLISSRASKYDNDFEKTIKELVGEEEDNVFLRTQGDAEIHSEDMLKNGRNKKRQDILSKWEKMKG